MLKRFSFLFLTLGLTVLSAHPVFAQNRTDFSLVAENATLSIQYIPGLITGLAYLLAIVLGVVGILKMKEHIENPSQVPLRHVVIRFVAAGALFGLPILLESMSTAIAGDDSGFAGFSFGSLVQSLGGVFGSFVGGTPGEGVNEVLGNIVFSIELVPGLISAVSYLLGLVLGYSAVLKVKEHVENPDNVKLSEGVVRLLVGGALFSLPTIYEAMLSLVAGDLGFGIGSFLAALFSGNILYSDQTQQVCGGSGPTIGAAMCHVVMTASMAPSFLNAIAYLFGLVLGVWALLKIRDHVLDPRQTPIWEGISRLFAGGMFFALPYMVEVVVSTVVGGSSGFFNGGTANTGFNDAAGGSCDTPAGLDVALSCMMRDIMGPIHALVNFFALVAGTIFVMIGISRLMKSAQEGAKGPGGVGTIMTFLTGGILISFNTILGAFSQTLFFNSRVMTFATLSYTDGLEGEEIAHVETVISAIIKFMIIIGLISFVRGWFIMRDVAEGNGQASAMAGTTHIIGGALAVNLGPLLQAVQSTLGITGLGINFGG